jgi:hypothetical protein
MNFITIILNKKEPTSTSQTSDRMSQKRFSYPQPFYYPGTIRHAFRFHRVINNQRCRIIDRIISFISKTPLHFCTEVFGARAMNSPLRLKYKRKVIRI